MVPPWRQQMRKIADDSLLFFCYCCIIFIRQFRRLLKRSSVLQLDFVYTTNEYPKCDRKKSSPAGNRMKKRGKLNSNQLNFELREKAINCDFAFSFSRERAGVRVCSLCLHSVSSTQISQLIVSCVVAVAVFRVFHFTIC